MDQSPYNNKEQVLLFDVDGGSMNPSSHHNLGSSMLRIDKNFVPPEEIKEIEAAHVSIDVEEADPNFLHSNIEAHPDGHSPLRA